MIDIKAKAGVKDGKKKGVAVLCHIHGEGLSIIEESIAIIRAIMDNLKKESETMHLMVLEEILENPGILTGEDSKEKIKVISEYLNKTKLN